MLSMTGASLVAQEVDDEHGGASTNRVKRSYLSAAYQLDGLAARNFVTGQLRVLCWGWCARNRGTSFDFWCLKKKKRRPLQTSTQVSTSLKAALADFHALGLFPRKPPFSKTCRLPYSLPVFVPPSSFEEGGLLHIPASLIPRLSPVLSCTSDLGRVTLNLESFCLSFSSSFLFCKIYRRGSLFKTKGNLLLLPRGEGDLNQNVCRSDCAADAGPGRRQSCRLWVAVFVLQSLGCDTAALNTVQFSNHTGYRHWTGTKATAEEIADLYRGLRDNYINDFDMMLSGYIPGAEGVLAVGAIAKELKTAAAARNRGQPGGDFFWVLDPVMGDNGHLYVAADVVPAYKSLLSYADLIIPNQFEAELLSDVKITDMDSLAAAIQALHTTHRVPHVIITSVSIASPTIPAGHLCVVGSTMTSAGAARLFTTVFPSIDCYFCGTGDMFGALVTVRLREAVAAAGADVMARASWVSDDTVAAVDLPLARATEKVLASMHEVLTHTKDAMRGVVERTLAAMTEEERAGETQKMVAGKKAAELQLVRNLDCLRAPKKTMEVRPF